VIQQSAVDFGYSTTGTSSEYGAIARLSDWDGWRCLGAHEDPSCRDRADSEWRGAAKPLRVTFQREFDDGLDMNAALEDGPDGRREHSEFGGSVSATEGIERRRDL